MCLFVRHLAWISGPLPIPQVSTPIKVAFLSSRDICLWCDALKQIEGCSAGFEKDWCYFTCPNSNLQESCIVLHFTAVNWWMLLRHSPKICLEPIAFIILYIAHSCMVTLGATSSLIPQNYIFLFQSSEKELIPGLMDSRAQDLTLPLLA